MGTPASGLLELKRRDNVNVPGVFEDEVPDHVVTIGDFRIDRFEVTNARFLEFVTEHHEWSRARIAPDAHNGRYLEHWVDGRPSRQREAVGSYPPNPLGLHDMAGNVWEFVLDAWKAGYAADRQTNPIAGGPVPGAFVTVQGRRVLRGAS